LYPANSGSTTYALGGSGSIVPVTCTTAAPSNSILYPYDCNLTLTGLSGQYYVRFLPIYQDASVGISATNSSNNPLPLTNGQLAADATGKAQDVLRRVEERIPAAQLIFPAAPNDALQSTNSICKQFTYTTSGGASGYGATTSC